MAFDVVIKDYNGDAQTVPVASNPPENSVLKSVRDHLQVIKDTVDLQETNIDSMESILQSVENEISTVGANVNDVKDTVSRQSYYTDMVHIDRSGESQLSDSDSLNTPVDAIVCMTSGELHVQTASGGERTIPVLPGVPHKCRITQVYETGTTASDIVGYIEN